MRIIKWGLAAMGLFVIGGVIAFGVLSTNGTASAQTPEEKSEARRARYEEVLAQKLGVSVQTLQTAQTSARNQMIDEALAAGKITAEQAEKMRNAGPGELRKGRVERVKDRVHGAVVNIFQAAAKTIGVSNEELKTEVQSGKSLAQVANAHNMTTDQLKTGITTEIATQLNAAVSAGKMTQQQADAINQRVAQNLDDIVNHSGGRPDLPKLERSRSR